MDVNQFASTAYRELAEGDQNLTFSPFNIFTALSMLLAGARGGTTAAIANVLHVATPDPGYHTSLAALTAEMTKAANTGPNELSSANALWLQRGYPLQSDFESILHEAYQAPLTPLDFTGAPEAARAEINSWTAQHTKDKIRDLLPAGSIHHDTRLVLTSAIYFYGKWRTPFKTADTNQEPFHPLHGDAVKIRFMHQTASFRYAQTNSLQILEMPYDGIPIAFDILLSKANDGLTDLERSLDFQRLATHFSTMTLEKVIVSIPKFRAESTISLNTTLSRMGMAPAFSKTEADFSGIDGRRDLYVSDAVHKAFVDVSEQGTEAAAATGIVARPAAIMRPREPIVFRADHPFVFLIRDTTNGVILFAGRFVQPKS